MATFKIGDKVKFLNAVGGGTVTRVTDDFVFVQDETGFDMPMPPNELIRMADMSGVGKMFNQAVAGATPAAEGRRDADPLKKKYDDRRPLTVDYAEENKRLRLQIDDLQEQIRLLRQQLSQVQNLNARKLNENILLQYTVRPDEAEVDLHIEALAPHPERLSDGEKHDLQLRFFRICLKHAIDNGYKKVVFIHGVGRGVLKSDIQRDLECYEGLHYMDAPMSLYGIGATEVYFGNKVVKIA